MQQAEGATSVILTTVTAKLSGTYNSALQAAQMETEIPVTVWDTTSVSLGEQRAGKPFAPAELVQAGAVHHEILATLPHIRDHITTVFTVDTLKYLAASGQLSSAQAMMGALLNIKPMLMVDEGILKPVGASGRRSAKTTLIDLALTKVGDAPVRVAIAHTNVLDEAQAFEPQVHAALNVQELLIVELGPVLATLVGPGVMALSGVMQVTP